jgi:hypothetical protein
MVRLMRSHRARAWLTPPISTTRPGRMQAGWPSIGSMRSAACMPWSHHGALIALAAVVQRRVRYRAVDSVKASKSSQVVLSEFDGDAVATLTQRTYA